MCRLGPGCNQTEPLTSRWKEPVCQRHYGDEMSLLMQFANDTYPGNTIQKTQLAEDYLKLGVLMRKNVDRCKKHMGKFQSEMRHARFWHDQGPRFRKNGEKRPGYFKLSRALEYFEGYCWWPASRMLFTGLLSDQQFRNAIDFGHAKDPGAGMSHGDQSHRVQWHVMCREITDNFSTPFDQNRGWTHSPLELFWRMVHSGTRAPVGDDRKNLNVWGYLIDNASNPGWGNPDDVKKDIAVMTGGLVAGAVNRRSTKWGSSVIKLGVLSTGIQNKTRELFGPPQQNARYEDELDIMNLVYEWQQIGVPVIRPRNAPPAPGKTLNVRYAAYEVYQRLDRVTFPLQGKGRYSVDQNTQLILKEDAPDRGVQINQQRVNSSRQGFNPEYTYTSFTGARPTREDSNRW